MTWQERMEIEGQELEEKIEKLSAFLDGGAVGVSPSMRALLIRQLEIMQRYSAVLQERFELAEQEWVIAHV